MIPGAYSPPDLEFLKSIASIFAPLIENTRLLAELKSHYEDAKEVLKKTESRLIETERTAAYVRLAQAMTHELRNPLTVIGGMVRRIARMHPQQEMGETREALMSSVQRMEVVLQEMEDFVSILTLVNSRGSAASSRRNPTLRSSGGAGQSARDLRSGHPMSLCL